MYQIYKREYHESGKSETQLAKGLESYKEVKAVFGVLKMEHPELEELSEYTLASKAGDKPIIYYVKTIDR